MNAIDWNLPVIDKDKEFPNEEKEEVYFELAKYWRFFWTFQNIGGKTIESHEIIEESFSLCPCLYFTLEHSMTLQEVCQEVFDHNQSSFFSVEIGNDFKESKI
jgi:hypothetical protein